MRSVVGKGSAALSHRHAPRPLDKQMRSNAAPWAPKDEQRPVQTYLKFP